MRSLRSPVFAVAALALVSIATPSFAGSPYYDAMGNPMTADQADMMHDSMMNGGMMNAGMMAPHPHAMGRYACSSAEKHTRMERQACGTTKMKMMN